jgi:hypothetical protein
MPPAGPSRRLRLLASYHSIRRYEGDVPELSSTHWHVQQMQGKAGGHRRRYRLPDGFEHLRVLLPLQEGLVHKVWRPESEPINDAVLGRSEAALES